MATGQLAGEVIHITSLSQAIEIETLTTQSKKAKGVDLSSKSGKANMKETEPWAKASHLDFPDKPLST